MGPVGTSMRTLSFCPPAVNWTSTGRTAGCGGLGAPSDIWSCTTESVVAVQRGALIPVPVIHRAGNRRTFGPAATRRAMHARGREGFPRTVLHVRRLAQPVKHVPAGARLDLREPRQLGFHRGAGL